MARLLFVTATATAVREGSGTAVAIDVLRKALEAAGHTVELFAPPPGVAATLPGRLRFAWSARRATERTSADTIVAFDMDGAFLPRARVPRVASIKGVIADEMRFERGGTRVSLAIQAALERRHVRRADRVLTTSRYAAGRIEELYGPLRSPVAIVPEPVDLTRWREAVARSPRKPTSTPAILCVAHLYPRKDVVTLARAAARMREPARVRIVGDGPEGDRIDREIERLGVASRVERLGHLPFAALAEAYRAADVFCLPSRQEGFGIVFVEAMAAGLPVVAADAGAAPELVAPEETGLLVQPGDADGLAAALDRLLREDDLRRRLGEEGRRRAVSYDAPRVARLFAETIGWTAAARAAPPVTSR
jgi:glycosyltransferase involved in cell wall biosynthesis